MEYIKYDILSLDRRELIDAAEKVMPYAYNPYSHFYVGADRK